MWEATNAMIRNGPYHSGMSFLRVWNHVYEGSVQAMSSGAP